MVSMKEYVEEVMGGIDKKDIEGQEHHVDYDDYFDQVICPFCKHPELNMIVIVDPGNAENRIILNECRGCSRSWVAANIEGEGKGLEINLRPLFPKKTE